MWLPLAICQNQIPGHKQVFKFGFNGAVSSSDETLWEQGGVYEYPSVASQMTVSSDDANDTSAGSGAQTIEIQGLKADYREVSEVVVLSGLAPVTTTNSYIRINRAIVRSGAINTGTIYVGTGTVTSGIPANIFTTIAADEGQSLQAFYTIPEDNTGHLHQVIASMFGNPNVFVTVRFCVREFGEIMVVRDKFTVSRGEILIPHEFQARIPPKADIEMRAVSSGVDVDCSGSFGLVLVRKGFEQAYLV